ncbi:MAG: M36 family metallopeptidase [Ardenticatenaceae bacterium]|nr:M36 family metallopeptidase [Ardenticatenaceae bacterium]
MKRTHALLLSCIMLVGLALVMATALPTQAQSDEVIPDPVINYYPESVSLANEGEIGFLSAPQTGEPLAVATDFLEENLPALGLQAADVADYVVTSAYVSAHNGVTHLYFRQRLEGIEVLGAEMNMAVDANGRILTLHSSFIPNLHGQAAGTAVLSPLDAVTTAVNHLPLTPSQPFHIKQTAGGPEQKTSISSGGIAATDIPVRLIYQPQPSSVRLAWDISLATLDEQHHWNIRIDAETGAILGQQDWVIHEDFQAQAGDIGAENSTATNAPAPAFQISPDAYLVYTLPVESPNHVPAPLPTPPADGRTLHTDPASPASPFGWHDTDGQPGHESEYTVGNNTDTYEDSNGNNTPTGGDMARAWGGPTLVFTHPINLSQPPSTYTDASITNLFYWVNITHDILYTYGFDEPAGNYQENNYGHGGASGDSVYAEGQDGIGSCFANFAIGPDGVNGRLQLSTCSFTTPARDGALDNTAIVHEYTHGLSTRLTGGPVNPSCLNNLEQMGEGWSDWFALMFTQEVGDAGPDARGFATYLFGQPPDGAGVRLAPYSTNLAVNNYTYANLITMPIPHGSGFLWATMLWEMNWGLIDDYGFNPDLYAPWNTGGNNLALQLVVDGLKFQPCSPGFVDGRNAILLADQVLTGGANQCTIWHAFAKRGLGLSASQGSSNSTSDGTAAFDFPLECYNFLQLHSSTDIDPAIAGGLLTYSLVVDNNTAVTLTNVILTDTIPLNTIYVPGSASNGGVLSGNALQWPPLTLASGQQATRTFQIIVDTDAGGNQYLADNFENGLGNWSTTGLWNQEGQSDPCGTLIAPYLDPTQAAYFGQDGTCTYDLGGQTAQGNLTYLNPINLTNASEPKLIYSSYEETECNGNCTWDNRLVQVSTNGGASWLNLDEGNMEGTWYTRTVDMTPYVGFTVHLRFRFDSTDGAGNGFFGWMVDDIRLAEEAFVFNTACVQAAEGDNACDNLSVPVINGSGGVPLIDVSPDALSSIQAPDAQFTHTLTIANVGNSDLTWDIFEDASPLVGPLPLPLAPTQVDSSAVQAGQAVSGEKVAAETAVSPNLITLYDQTDNPANTSFASQFFPDLGAAVQGADDFIVPDYEEWHVDQVFAEGLYSAGDGPAPTWIVEFYADGGGLPGTLLSSQTGITATTDISGIVTLDLNTPVVLPPGTYWVSVLADMAFNPGVNEQWFWRARAVQSGQPYHWQDPANLITSVNCPTWMPVCDGSSAPNSDALFALNGTINILPCDAPDAISWATVSPLNGTTAANSSSPVTVVFDSTGLVNGTYTGTLCVNSNDVLQPQIPVPLTLTVVTPTFGVALSPDAMIAGDAGTTAQTTLTVTNTGNVADSFTLAATGNGWATTLGTTAVTLPPGGSSSVTVSVDIPADVFGGEMDVATITAVSQSDAGVSDTAIVTTTANIIEGVILAPNSTATALPGDTVTYTMMVTNTSNITATFDLSTSGNVWNTAVAPLNTTLAPNAASIVIVTVTVPAEAIGGTTDTTTITAAQSGGSATDSATVATTAVTLYGLTFTDDASLNGPPGATLSVTLWLTNTGNITDSYDVSVSGHSWDTTLSDTTIMLGIGASAQIVAEVTIPADALAGAMDMATVTAVSQSDAATTGSISLTTTADAVYGTITGPDAATKTLPGTTITYTVAITNPGNITDTYDLSLTNVWPTTVNPASLTLAPFSAGGVQVVVSVPGDAAFGEMDTAVLTATSQGNSSSHSTHLTTTAGAPYFVILTTPDADLSGTPGTTVTYTLWLTNTGNLTDTYDLTTSGTWTTTTSLESATLAGGEGIAFMVWVTIPAEAEAGAMDTTTVQADGTASASLVLTTTAVAPPDEGFSLYLPFVTKN